MGKKLELSVDQRVEVAMAVVRREERAAKIARRYGISEQTLYRLRDQLLEGILPSALLQAAQVAA